MLEICMGKSRYVNLYLPQELVDAIDELAEADERSRNFIIKKILEQHVAGGKRK